MTKLTEEQRKQMEEQTRIGVYTKFLASQAAANTASIPDGKKFAQQLVALCGVLDRQRHHYITTIFDSMNVKEAKLNIDTGELTDIVLKEI